MIKIEVNLDSVVVENCTLGTDAWLPWVEYPSGNAAKDIYNITAYFPNGTVTAVPEGTGYNQWYYYAPWPCEVECDMLNATQYVDGTILEVTYLGFPRAEINYTASLPTVYAEHRGTYSDFLADLSDPVCSDWDELLPDPTREYHCIGWNDTDSSGNVTVCDYLLLSGAAGNLTYHVDHLATDLIVDQEQCICEVDPSHEYFCEPLIVDVAGFPHPERDMCPWHGSELAVPLPHKVENATFCAFFKPPGSWIDLFTQYPDPFGGQGPDAPSDMFWTQKEVCLFAYVTYNFWPEQNKDVLFKVFDPYGDPFAALYGRTNASGIATVCFRMPWTCDNPEYYIGEWTVLAEVDVACECINDTLTFKYDHLVNIWDVTTDKEAYAHCEEIAITVDYGSYAIQDYNITFTVTITDETGVPFGYIEVTILIGGAEYCTYMNGSFTVYLHVHKWARAGVATIHVGALDDRGNPITPGFTAEVGILAEWAP
jgi:hypothetical protein